MRFSERLLKLPTWLLLLTAAPAQWLALEIFRGIGRAEERVACYQEICGDIAISVPNLIPYDILLGISANLFVALCAFIIGKRQGSHSALTD